MTNDSKSTGDALEPQCADAVLMVRPAAFDYNPHTAGSNALQHRVPLGGVDVAQAAVREFDAVAAALRGAGVRVCIASDTPQPPKPDAVFPNNWVSFHADGTVVVYPLASASRRRERRLEIVAQAARELGFHVRRTLDLTHRERTGGALEGTGSLVLDRVNRIAYACRSPRTDPGVLAEWSNEMGYDSVLFAARDAQGRAVYHTNVLLSIGAGFVIVAAEAIALEDRGRVLERLAASDREVVAISQAQLGAFAANVLELAVSQSSGAHRSLMVMSTTARQAFADLDLARLQARVDRALSVSVPTIERVGGGGVRCMLTEVFSTPC